MNKSTRRLTLDISDELYEQLKVESVIRRSSMKDVIVVALSKEIKVSGDPGFIAA